MNEWIQTAGRAEKGDGDTMLRAVTSCLFILASIHTPALAQTTWVVDGAGGADFTSIQACIDVGTATGASNLSTDGAGPSRPSHPSRS